MEKLIGGGMSSQDVYQAISKMISADKNSYES
jgi:hypothetical protein